MSDPESEEQESDEEQEDFQQLQVRETFFLFGSVLTVWSEVTEVHIYIFQCQLDANLLLPEIEKDFNCVQ